jgi:hypothetical protein
LWFFRKWNMSTLRILHSLNLWKGEKGTLLNFTREWRVLFTALGLGDDFFKRWIFVVSICFHVKFRRVGWFTNKELKARRVNTHTGELGRSSLIWIVRDLIDRPLFTRSEDGMFKCNLTSTILLRTNNLIFAHRSWKYLSRLNTWSALPVSPKLGSLFSHIVPFFKTAIWGHHSWTKPHQWFRKEGRKSEGGREGGSKP